MYGMGMGRFFVPPIGPRTEALLQKQNDEAIEKLKGALKKPVEKPLADRVRDQALELLSKMNDRRDYWQKRLVEATEELRQTELAFEAATAMLTVLERDRLNPADEKVLDTLATDIVADLHADIAQAKAASQVDHPLDI